MLTALCLQLLLLIAFPVYISLQTNSRVRIVSMYSLLCIILFMGGFLGAVYTVPIAGGLQVSGGIIAYASFMMTSVLFVFVERDIFIFRNIVRLVLTVTLFKVVMFYSLSTILDSPETININGVPAKLFETSVPFVITGATLIILELLLLLYLFDALRMFIKHPLTLALLYWFSFSAILLLDGVIYPVMLIGLQMDAVTLIIGNLPSKLFLAVVFGGPLLVYMLVSKERFARFIRDDAVDWRLLFSSNKTIMQNVVESAQKLSQAEALFQQTRDGIVVTDAQFNIETMNRAFEGMLSAALRSTKSKSLPVLLDLTTQQQADMQRSLESQSYWQQEICWKARDGSKSHGMFSLTPVLDFRDNLINYAGSLTDISELSQMRDELRFQATHDALTGLPNRRLLRSNVQKLIDTQSGDHTIGLLLIDLDNFKTINDSYGHMVGDQVLMEVGRRLISLMGSKNVVFRLGGDEFSLYVCQKGSCQLLTEQAEAIRQAINKPMEFDDRNLVRVDCCIGIACTELAGKPTFENLYQQADTALYWAKGERKGTVRNYDISMTQHRRARLDIESRLRQAIDSQELHCYFQPKVSMQTGNIEGAEALIRWITGNGTMVSPAEFIPLAEETGLISKITEFVVLEACRCAMQWHSDDAPFKVAVNISPAYLEMNDLQGVIAHALEETGLPASALELEITESALVKRETEVIPLLEQIRKRGISIALDDFGTGYSSLAYLHQLPIDTLKIDRSFVAGLPDEESSRELAQTIIAMALNLGCELVAEGVETAEQLAFLADKGCHWYQGFYFSKPLPQEEFSALLTSHKAGQ